MPEKIKRMLETLKIIVSKIRIYPLIRDVTVIKYGLNTRGSSYL